MIHKRWGKCLVMKVLVSCYACSPYKGSEPGVGWNMAVALAKYHQVWVVTRKKNKNVIDEYLHKVPIANLHFIYFDVPFLEKTVKRISDFLYYQCWNLLLISRIKEFVTSEQIDIIHHLTFNQYRTQSFGYYIDKPFVIGPIGGAELIDSAFVRELGTKTSTQERWRKHLIDAKLFSKLLRRNSQPKMVLFSAKENYTRLCSYIPDDVNVCVMPAIGISPEDFDSLPTHNKGDKPFTMVYAGRILDWKGLHTFLEAVALAQNKLQNVRVELVGVNDAKDVQLANLWLGKCGLNAITNIISWMPREQLLHHLTEIDLFVYPAFRDSGSMAVLEACAIGCPTICYDAGGQDAFPNDCVVKVQIIHGDYNKTLVNFSEKILWAYKNRSELQEYGVRAKEYVRNHLSWQNKAKIVSEYYAKLIQS